MTKSLPKLLIASWILTVFGVTALGQEKPLFEEKFRGKFSDGWTWIDEVPGSWQLIDGAMELKVLPVGEGLVQAGRKHPNLFVRDPGQAGDFAVEVQIKSQPTGQFEHAGLILFADGDNYVVLKKEKVDKTEVLLVAEKNAKPTQISKPYEHEEICLRLSVTGNQAVAQYRHYDSDEWQTLGARDLPVQGPYKVGVLAGRPPEGADHRALFSHFRILPKLIDAPVSSSESPFKKTKLDSTPLTQKKRSLQTDVSVAFQAREAAERAIPYIEKDGAAWINDRKCLSCHYAGYMLWSFRDVSARGFAINQEKMGEWNTWSLAQRKDHGAEGAAQVLLARDRLDHSDETIKSIEALSDFIISKQEKDGFWKPGGQLPGQKRPLSETTQVSTMICVLGLATLDPSHEKATDSRNKAVAWIKKTPPNGDEPAVSGEWYTMRLLVEKKFGAPKEVEILRDKILAAQQSDGGWGWLWADTSDAFGTGLALYALAEGGVSSSHPAVEKAWKFLIETQADSGAWIVNGTKTTTKDKPHSMSSFWGSTWALMGISKSLPDAETKRVQAPVPALSPPVVTTGQ